MKNKIIFLDVDGVLNSARDGFSIDLETDIHLKLLKQLVKETNANIVLSSSWKIGFGCSFSLSNTLISRLKEHGLSILDITPEREDGNRILEIKEWISKNPVKNILILDDEEFDIRNIFPNNFVKINNEIGLQEKDVKKGIKILNNDFFERFP